MFVPLVVAYPLASDQPHVASSAPSASSVPSTAQMLCAGTSRQPPSVAVCLVGMARTFAHELVHRSFGEYVLQSLGCPVTAFAHLKLDDARGDTSRAAGGLIRANATLVRAAAARIGIPRERVHLTHDGGFEHPTCPDYPPAFDANKTHLGSPNHYESLLGQLYNRKRCYDMVEAHEAATGSAFDWILLTRPDLTWYRPMKPWCMHAALREPVTVNTTVMHKSDWVYLLPRTKAAELLLEPLRRHYACETPFDRRSNVENFWRVHVPGMAMSSGSFHSNGTSSEPGNLPAIVTRIDADGFPNNICNTLVVDFDDIGRRAVMNTALCANLTFANPYNRPVGEPLFIPSSKRVAQRAGG